MKKSNRNHLLRGFIAFWAVVPLFLIGCSEDDTYIYNVIDDSAAVIVELVSDVTVNKAVVKFIPGAGVSKVSYALGTENNRSTFNAGTLTGIQTVEGDAAFTVTFDNLAPATEYTVFAKPYTADGTASAVVSLLINTFNDTFTVTNEYLSDASVAYRIYTSSDYYAFSFALGKASDKTAFKNGTLSGIQKLVEPLNGYVANYFDLEPETDYVFYCVAHDRHDNPSIIIEEAFRTPAKSNSVPDVTIQTDALDVFAGVFTVTPNSQCGKIYVLLYEEGNFSETSLFDKYTWYGDFAASMPVWGNTSAALTSNDGTPIQVMLPLYNLMLDKKMYLFVTMYDKNGNLTSVKRYTYSTPSYNAQLSPATVTLRVSSSELELQGGTYYAKVTVEFTASNSTVLFFWDVDKKADLDPVLADNTLGQYYIHELFNSGGYLAAGYYVYCGLGNYTGYATYSGLALDTDYYVLACPMNGNGPVADNGWGNLFVTPSFRTPAAP